MPPHKPLVAAIFNTSPDLVDVVRRAFEPAGIVVVSVLTYQIREAAVDLENFLKQHNPDVIVYDIAPPYDANWQLFLHIRSLEAMQGRTTSIEGLSREALTAHSLNAVLAAGRASWTALHERVDEAVRRSPGDFVDVHDLNLRMPFEVADYVDFYSSIRSSSRALQCAGRRG